MKRDLLNGAVRLVALMLVWAVLVMVASGCNAHATHKHVSTLTTPMPKNWKPGKRCKTVGKAMTSHVAVLVERNCLKNGLTTVNMIVLNKEKKGNVAAEHAVQAVTSILGFKPVLKILFYGKTKGKVFFMTAVTGVMEVATPVAKR